MSIQVDTGDGFKTLTGLSSGFTVESEPPTEGDRIGQELRKALSPAIQAFSMTFRIIEARFGDIAKAFEIGTTPRDQRNNAMHRYGRHLSATRSAYRAKTKHRRRNR